MGASRRITGPTDGTLCPPLASRPAPGEAWRMDHSTESDTGITTIDTGFFRPRFDAAYLVVEQGRAAFIDVGTNHSVPRLLDALQAQGLGVEAVDHVLLTHVHLDHAGGRRRADARTAQRAARGASAGRPAHDRPVEADRRRHRGVRRGRDGAQLRGHPRGAGRAGGRGAGWARGRPRRSVADLPGCAGPCAPPLRRARPAQRRLLHRRHLRPVLPRVRYRPGCLHRADHIAGAVRARRAGGIGPAHAVLPALGDVRDPLRARHRRRAAGRRHGGTGRGDGADRPQLRCTGAPRWPPRSHRRPPGRLLRRTRPGPWRVDGPPGHRRGPGDGHRTQCPGPGHLVGPRPALSRPSLPARTAS
ncbi:MBL fold metallo-hydrolase [Alkalisalibacterium limincola]|uniref:MBL fold metallo-hydrolase n=1 Tax=Alkalisalibacterium limincola TaxID=2699169 RepID=A0A5C8KYY9_9GAMM|nr:MBL fold metallo-hydrolase [Alkalisalibacterium limincola]